MTNYCTLDDVKQEGIITVDTYDDNIIYKIGKVSREIDRIKRDSANLEDVRNCCIYGVLSWLEQNPNLSSFQENLKVASKSEGDRSISYYMTTPTVKKPNNSTEWYWYYYARIKKSLSIGIVVVPEEEDNLPDTISRRVYGGER